MCVMSHWINYKLSPLAPQNSIVAMGRFPTNGGLKSGKNIYIYIYVYRYIFLYIYIYIYICICIYIYI